MDFLTHEEQCKIMNELSEKINKFLNWKLPNAQHLTGAFYLSFEHKGEDGKMTAWGSDYSIGEGRFVGDLIEHIDKTIKRSGLPEDMLTALKDLKREFLINALVFNKLL